MPHDDRRILTTHAGSLPRSRELVDLLVRRSQREPVDNWLLQDAITASTREVVRQQLASGIDAGNDGEQGRESFFTYIQHRMSGFAGETRRPPFQDRHLFPSFLEHERARAQTGGRVNLLKPPRIVGPVAYLDRAPIAQEVAQFQTILAEQQQPFLETFMTAPSPGIVAAAMANDYYPDQAAAIRAVGAALRTEYECIAAQGLTLQLDCPDLAMERHVAFAERPLDDFLAFVALVIDTINAALEQIPPERVRLHICWGNYNGPHLFDVPLQEILPQLYRARVGALLLSMANPRHEHEYRVFEQLPLPDGMKLVTGVIDTTTNYVEHPEVIADRLERAARAIGDPSRILAGTDCGFDTAAGSQMVAAEVVWAKLRSLREGADLASRRFFYHYASSTTR